jgi:hypothetical protein
MKSPKNNNPLEFDDIHPLTKEFRETDFEDLEISKISELKNEKEKFVKEFADLLDNISSTEDKQKSLWKQIFENAVTDRVIAYIVWHDLYKTVYSNPSEHAIHGQNLARYMERMSKANEQLIKLSEQVFMAKKKDDSIIINEEDIYSTLEKETEKSKN